MTRRREFMSLLGGAAAWPLAASAQQSDPMRHVGVSMSQPQTDAGWQRAIATFLEALEQLGWVRERNLRIEFRWGEVTPNASSVTRPSSWGSNPTSYFVRPLHQLQLCNGRPAPFLLYS